MQFGEGGKDSKLFVHELASVYIRYGQSKGFKSQILESSEGHMIIRFKGANVWKAFEQEVGKHCVQRIGPTETKGRKHTSFVAVAVLPLPEPRLLKPIPENELEITFQRGHGKGGQHQNTTDSACRIVHPRTQLSVFINGRDQHANRRDAIRIITARINQFDQEKKDREYGKKRKVLSKGGRGETDKIRTYNFLKGFAVDHRTGKKTNNIKGVMKGDLNLLM
ncbi:MAG: PCRF domain-containing protein [Crenarchaeota archaeon]|nr:MAG: PCRF domain-containing protein [Thermoproteota archaeon]